MFKTPLRALSTQSEEKCFSRQQREGGTSVQDSPLYCRSLALCVGLLLSPLHGGKEVYFHCSPEFLYDIEQRLRSACCRLYLLDRPSVNATPPVGGQTAPPLHHHHSSSPLHPHPLFNNPTNPSCNCRLVIVGRQG